MLQKELAPAESSYYVYVWERGRRFRIVRSQKFGGGAQEAGIQFSGGDSVYLVVLNQKLKEGNGTTRINACEWMNALPPLLLLLSRHSETGLGIHKEEVQL